MIRPEQHLPLPDPGDVYRTPEEVAITEIRYGDGSMNTVFSGQGIINPEVESMWRNDGNPEMPYCLRTESGADFFVSPGHGGVTTLIIDRDPRDKAPGKTFESHFLPDTPQAITLGQRYEFSGEGFGFITEPVKRVTMLSNGHPSTPHDTHTSFPHEKNPVLRYHEYTEMIIERAKAVGKISQTER